MLVVFILAAAGAMAFMPSASAPAAEGEGPYQWRFVEWGTDDRPRTQVTLMTGGKTHTIGTYDGSCAVMNDGDYLPYEVSKVICWFAGGGHEVGVFEEPGQVVVRVGEVDEGASGIQGFRGNFVLVKRL